MKTSKLSNPSNLKKQGVGGAIDGIFYLFNFSIYIFSKLIYMDNLTDKEKDKIQMIKLKNKASKLWADILLRMDEDKDYLNKKEGQDKMDEYMHLMNLTMQLDIDSH